MICRCARTGPCRSAPGGERLRNSHGLKLHPTQKPEALLHRVIMASTNPGDIIVDPFLGTGTTATVAKRLHRHFVGIERHPAYVEAAWGRREGRGARAQDRRGRSPQRARRAAHRLRQLRRARDLPPGTQVTDKQRRVAAEVTAEGQLVSGAHRGSIHQVGAAVQNAPSCNGWTFWHFEREGALLPLDALRKESHEG